MERDGFTIRIFVERRRQLQELMAKIGTPILRLSEGFPDGPALLRACQEHGLEGIVSKRLDLAYKAGASKGWVKVKTEDWRASNRWRGTVMGRRR